MKILHKYCVCAIVHIKNSRCTTIQTKIPCKSFSCYRSEGEGRSTRGENVEWSVEARWGEIYYFIGSQEMCIGSSRVVKTFFHLLHWNYYEYENSFYVRFCALNLRLVTFINQFNFPLRETNWKKLRLWLILKTFPPTQFRWIWEINDLLSEKWQQQKNLEIFTHLFQGLHRQAQS